MAHGNGVLYLLVILCLVELVSSQCLDCTDYGYCVETAEDGTCTECVCPTGFGGDCCEIDAPPITCNDNPCGSDDDKHFKCDNLAHGLYLCSCEPGWEGSDCDKEIDPCDPNPCQNAGTCSSEDGSFTCDCKEWFTGDICETIIDCLEDSTEDQCDCTSDLCQNGGTCVDYGLAFGYKCICASNNFTGDKCEKEPCNPNNCEHGGHCYTKSDGNTKCMCLSIWKGSKCTDFNICGNSACQNGGTCVASSDGKSKTCKCAEGWTGELCDEWTNNCEPNPCKEDGTCTNKFKDFSCDCIFGLEGKDCSDNPDDCDLKDGKTPCNHLSKANKCNDGYGTYTCMCSPEYTGSHCNMSIYVARILEEGGDAVSIIELLEDVVASPPLIKDILPFLLGQLSQENQSSMSWDAEDLFVWAAYERTELDIFTDIYKWFDITLGNCFTFNHRNSSKSYNVRYAGSSHGFEALIRVRQDEYLAWIDTAAIIVFVHPSNETIFSESVRYQVAPSTVGEIITSKVSFQRLSGKYGSCANSVDEVNSYYYTGSYTTAGCLRSCYQDAVQEACDCMDPRYAMPEDANPCPIKMWNCVQNVTELKGDASNWPECSCPAPCEESQFESDYNSASRISRPFQCDQMSSDFFDCMIYEKYMALISVMMPRLSQRLFVESPKMTFNQFISYIGGMAGMFIGFSIITIVDLVMLVILLIRACLLK